MWYEIILESDDNGAFVVTVPAFSEITTFGENDADAHKNALAAIEEAIAARISDGEDLPASLKKTDGEGVFVEISALVFLKSALYTASRSQNVSRAELARRLGWHREQVDRLFRLDHNSQIGQLEAAFRALDISLGFHVPSPSTAKARPNKTSTLVDA